MSEESLEEYQKKAFKTDRAKFTFTAKHTKVEETKASAPLTTHNAKFQIYFMRYVLFPSNKVNDSNSVYRFDEELQSEVFPDSYQPKNAPKIKDFDYYYSTVNTGFIYIYDQDSQKWQEFVVDEFGLVPIFWKKDKEGNYPDIRPISDRDPQQFYPVKEPEKNLWVAYSSLQWSAAYANEVFGSEVKRSSRMQKITCDDWKGANACMTDAQNIKDISAVFYPDTWDDDKLCVQKATFLSAWQNLSVDNDGNDYGNMFFALNDAFGVCESMSVNLAYRWLEMDALLISLKTGVTTSRIMECLINKGNPEDLVSNKKDLEQIKALFNIGTTLRSVAFANEENKEDLVDCWGGMDVERLDTVLAVKERKLLQKAIQKARENLINSFSDNYFGHALQDFINNTPDNLAIGKIKLTQLLSQLSLLPNFKDGFMETSEESSKWNSKNDKGQQFIKQVLQGENNIGKVFNETTILEDIEVVANYFKWIGITNGLFDIASGLKDDGDKILESIVEKSNKTRFKIKGALQETAFELVDLGKEFSKSDVGRSDFVKKSLNINKKTLKEFKNLSKKRIKGLNKLLKAKQIKLTEAFSNAAHSDKASGISDFQGSPRWTKLLRNLSFFNLTMAGAALRKSDTSFQQYLNYAKFFNGIADSYVVVRDVKVATKNVVGKLDDFAAKTKLLGKRIVFVGVIIDAAEAGYNFWERDYDAAMTYSGAAIAGGLAILCLSTGTAMAWNPVGWILLIAAGVIGFYAAFLEDTPLERIVKNGIFGEIPSDWFFWDKVEFKGNYIKQINAHVVPETRDLMHKKGFSDWEHLPTQYSQLMDILVGGRVTLKITEKENISGFTHTNAAEKEHISLSRDKAIKIKAQITFGGYLNHQDQLEYFIYYLKNGLGYDHELIMSHEQNRQLDIVAQPDKPTKAMIEIPICDEYHTEKALILVMTRIKISEGQYFPLPSNNTPHYVASIMPTMSMDYHYNFLHIDNINERVVVSNQKQLLSNKEWK